MMGDTPAEGVKLVDFGLSRVISKDCELTQMKGTPDYVGTSKLYFRNKFKIEN